MWILQSWYRMITSTLSLVRVYNYSVYIYSLLAQAQLQDIVMVTLGWLHCFYAWQQVIWRTKNTLQLKQGGGGTELLAEVVTDVAFMASVERERRDSISWQWFMWLTDYSIGVLALSPRAAEFVFFSTSCLLTSRVLLINVNLEFEHSRLQRSSGWS